MNNGSDHGSLESQSLRDGFKTISRLIHVNYFIIIYFIIVDSGICHDTCCEKYHKPSDTNGDIVWVLLSLKYHTAGKDSRIERNAVYIL